MDCFSNKILLFEKNQIKNNVKNNFGVIKNINIVDSDLINNLNKKTKNHKNLLVIPHHLKNLFLSKKNIENCQFFRKNKKINNKNTMITDYETIKHISFLKKKYHRIYLLNADKIQLKEIQFDYHFLWLFVNNPDLIYFNKSKFYQRLIYGINFGKFENSIIKYKNKKQINFNKYKIKTKYYVTNLFQQLSFLNNANIENLQYKIAKDYKIYQKKKDVCSICLQNKKLITYKCCPQNICLCCYLINKKHYNKCPFCRKKYIEHIFSLNNSIMNFYIYVFSKITRTDINFNNLNLSQYRKIKCNIMNNITYILIAKNEHNKFKKILFINTTDTLIKIIMDKYLYLYNKYIIINYKPKIYKNI